MKEEFLAIIEKTLDEVLPKEGERPAELSEAMRYAVGAGGKRIRPLICLASAVAVGGKAEDARYPAMDNDTERRGKPSVWAKFGEANAILAGDALQALAFKAAANAPRNVAGIVAALGAAGVGVVQGQVEDLKRESGTDGTSGGPASVPVEVVDFVYAHKTADLFVAAAAMGALAGGGDAASVEKLRTFALNLGLAFQYEDDLLDGDSPYSREKTESLVRETTAASVAALEGLPGDTAFLKSLSEKLVGRTA